MESNLLNKPKLLNNKHLEKKNEIQTKNFESSKLLIYRQRRQNLCYKLPKLPPRFASAAYKKNASARRLAVALLSAARLSPRRRRFLQRASENYKSPPLLLRK